MTGYGRSRGEGKDSRIEIDIKSVNSRYLEVRPHIPRIFAPFEKDLQAVVRKIFHRGAVDIYVQRKSKGVSETPVFNKPLINKWVKGFKSVLKEAGVSSEVSPEVLISIPDFYFIEEAGSSIREKKLLLKITEQACKDCQNQRSLEGLRLKKDILGLLAKLSKLQSKLESQRKKSVKVIEKKWKSKYQELLKNDPEGKKRSLQEIALLIEKSDVHEELIRLQSHIKAVESCIKGKKNMGKRLDFFAQEFLREINTIGSKCSAAEMTLSVVEAKDIVEKFREQVQNLE